MLERTSAQVLAAATQWRGRMQAALWDGQEDAIAALFVADAWWRDVVGASWRIATVGERAAIAAAMVAADNPLREIALAEELLAPTLVQRGGRDCIELFFSFTTAQGSGTGVARLVGLGDTWHCWTLMTALGPLHERDGAAKDVLAERKSHSRDFRGPNWKDLRDQAVAYTDRDPAVIVVGGGQAGLAIAAQLSALGVDTLIVDRETRIGDNWRLRYHALTLHNQTQVNHLPLMPFPESWPPYIPKDKLANWFEAYVEALELNFWTETEFAGARYDEAAGHWTVTLNRRGETITMRPRHVVMATGVSGIPNVPDIPALAGFEGPVLHSSQYTDGDDWTGKSAIIFGSGNSAHDIAQDLTSAGGRVTMVQRSPTLVVNIEPSAQLPYAIYSDGLSTRDCDLIAQATPFPVVRDRHRSYTQQSEALDKDLLDGLRAKGFQLHSGIDGTGWQFLYLTRGGGYYFNVGASDMIAEGRIGLIQHDDIEGFEPSGAKLIDGRMLPADLVVLSTGYMPQERVVERLFGSDVAERVGAIWGFDEDGLELRNMFCRTPQPGLYFIAGSLAQCRIFSKPLALQIKAAELGIV